MVKLSRKKSTTNIPQPTTTQPGDDSVAQIMTQVQPEPQEQAATNQPVSVGLGKEREFFAQADAVALEEIRKELEVAPEVKEAGVEARKEEIELPPAVQKLGVIPSDANQPVTPIAANLPITDDKIVTGTGAPVVTSLRWLVEWCLRQLKKVHVKLKKVHGRIIRITTK